MEPASAGKTTHLQTRRKLPLPRTMVTHSTFDARFNEFGSGPEGNISESQRMRLSRCCFFSGPYKTEHARG